MFLHFWISKLYLIFGWIPIRKYESKIKCITLWCFTRTVSRIIVLPIKSRQRVISYNYGFDWQVLESSSNIYKTLPENIDYENTKKILSVDPSPLNVVLLQEIERYNALLNMIRKQLIDLERGIQGLVVMSTELEEIFSCIYNGQVPPPWEKVFIWSFKVYSRTNHFQIIPEICFPRIMFLCSKLVVVWKYIDLWFMAR